MNIGMLAQKLSFAGDFRQAGVSRYIEYLLRYLPDVLSDDEHLHVLAGNEAYDRSSVEPLPESLRWHWTRWPTERVPVRILWEQLAAPWITRRLRINVVHGPVNVVPLLDRTPSIVTIHDLAFLAFPDQYPGLQRRYLKTLTATSARKARRVIAVSGYTGRDVAERLNVRPERITAIPNGVSEHFYPRDGTKELAAFRIRHELPDEFLLFVGTLQPRKNLIGLLRAYGSLNPGERIPLYVVGSPGWMYSDIFDEVSRLGIGADVHFPGYAASDALPLWYSAATAFIYPSFYEGFGLPVLEAMACGAPVVTSNVSSLPEVVGGAGIMVDPADTDHIADGIRSILGDDSLRAELAKRGVTRASEFSWCRTASETAAVYREVAGEG
jgi:glycosyltransferase involved in cell wall biosynthesis